MPVPGCQGPFDRTVRRVGIWFAPGRTPIPGHPQRPATPRGLPGRPDPLHAGVVRIAFKEWAVVVEALGRGRQSLILRKGGIAEGPDGFVVDHREFLLFPTRFHQEAGQVVPEARDLLPPPAGSAAVPPPDRVLIEFFAVVTGWRQLRSLDEALALSGQHVWTPEVIASRFDWGGEASISMIALRIFRLPRRHDLTLLPAYGGCRSWVELTEPLPVEGATPVLSEAIHSRRMAAIGDALGAPWLPAPTRGSPARTP